MDELVIMIEQFIKDIYLNMPDKLNESYIHICEAFNHIVDETFMGHSEIISLKQQILGQMLTLFESRDYTIMANYLEEQLIPLIEEMKQIG